MSVSKHMIQTIGVKRALQLQTWLVLWAVYLQAEGHEPAAADFAREVAGYSESTYYRRLDDFRECFPAHRTPAVLVMQWLEATGKKPLSTRAFARVRWEAS